MTTATVAAQISKTRKAWRQPTVLLPAISLMFGYYLALTMALVPLYMYANGYEVATIGVIVAAQAVFQLLLRLFIGAVSDRYGEQRVMIAAFFAMFISALVFMASAEFWPMIAAQLFTGVSRAAFMPASKSYGSRIDEGHAASALGRIQGTMALGTVAGPLSAGFLAATLGFQAAFGFTAVVGLLGVVFAGLLPALPRLAPHSLAASLARVPGLMRSWAMALPGLVGFTAGIGVAAVTSVFVVHLRETDSSEAAVGLMLTVLFLGASVTSFAFGRIMKKLGTRNVFALGFGASGIAIVGLAIAPNLAVHFAVGLFAGLAMGLPTTLWSVLGASASKPQERGVAMAVAGLYWTAGMLIVPAALGTVAMLLSPAAAVISAGALPIAVAAATPLAFSELVPKPTPAGVSA